MRRVLRGNFESWAGWTAVAVCALVLSGCPDDGESANEPTVKDAATTDSASGADGTVGGLDDGTGGTQSDAGPSGGDDGVTGGDANPLDDGGSAADAGPEPPDAAADGGQDGGAEELPDGAADGGQDGGAEELPDGVADGGQDGGAEELPDGAWGKAGDPLPEGAVLVSESELAEMQKNGVWVQVPPDYKEQAKAKADARHEANLAIVKAFAAEHPELEESLLGAPTDPAAKPTGDGNYVVTVPDGAGGEETVILQGERAQIATVASALQRYPTLDNQVALFERIAPMMPDACKNLVPDAAGLAALDAQALEALNSEMSECWWNSEMAVLEAPAEGDAPLVEPQTVDPDDAVSPDQAEGVGALGNDDPECGAPTQPWYGSFPFKAYLSTVKSQGNRGTCTAFGTVSAMEYLVAWQHKKWVNLSEQKLYAKAKLQWYDEPYGDGLSTGDLTEDLVDSGLSIPFEVIWDYNRSPDRKKVPEKETYLYSCVGYKGQACSDTTHQSELVCTNLGPVQYCGYFMPSNPSGSGWAVKSEYEVLSWWTGNTSNIKMLLTAGLPLIGSFDFSTGWFSGTDGYLGSFPAVSPGKTDGGHTVHLVGWIPNAKLAKEHRDIFGGGRYVIKNSHGCSSQSDHGYLYYPESWFNMQVRSVRGISVKKKGGNIPPEIEIVEPKFAAGLSYGGLDNTMKITAEVADPEDGAGCCSVVWHSSMDGKLGEGLSIDASFDTPGHRVITATVQDSNGAKSTDKLFVNAYNSSPVPKITQPASDGAKVYKGATVLFSGEATDDNQPLGLPCDSFHWTSDKLGDPMPPSGCEIDTVFTSLGPRTISLTVFDEAGGKGVVKRTIQVVEPIPGTKPIVTIVSPKAGDLLDPDKFGQVKGTAFDPDGSTSMTYSWTIQVGGGPEKEISTELDFFWKPGSHIPFDCGGNSGTLRFYATDEDGTGEASVEVLVSYGPC